MTAPKPSAPKASPKTPRNDGKNRPLANHAGLQAMLNASTNSK